MPARARTLPNWAAASVYYSANCLLEAAYTATRWISSPSAGVDVLVSLYMRVL